MLSNSFDDLVEQCLLGNEDHTRRDVRIERLLFEQVVVVGKRSEPLLGLAGLSFLWLAPSDLLKRLNLVASLKLH